MHWRHTTTTTNFNTCFWSVWRDERQKSWTIKIILLPVVTWYGAEATPCRHTRSIIPNNLSARLYWNMFICCTTETACITKFLFAVLCSRSCQKKQPNSALCNQIRSDCRRDTTTANKLNRKISRSNVLIVFKCQEKYFWNKMKVTMTNRTDEIGIRCCCCCCYGRRRCFCYFYYIDLNVSLPHFPITHKTTITTATATAPKTTPFRNKCTVQYAHSLTHSNTHSYFCVYL